MSKRKHWRAKAAERDTPARVKELQARWQTHAKSIVLAQRDERTLWERFRAACNAVFDARTGSRKEADERRNVQRKAFEALCDQMEQLAQPSDADETKVRGALRELQEQWRKAIAEGGPAQQRSRPASRQRAPPSRTCCADGPAQAKRRVGRRCFAKEQLCEELDTLALQWSRCRPNDRRVRPATLVRPATAGRRLGAEAAQAA